MPPPEHSTQPEFLEWLSSLGQLIETHASWVVLTADEAFKFKKPLDLGFLDFSTREKREACCLREVELNRRLAPSVYQSVVPLYLGPAGYALDPEDPAALGGAYLVDHAVAMRRLREDDRADVLLRAGRLDSEHLERLATRLVQFHAGLPGGSGSESARATSDLVQNVRENFTQLAAQKTLPTEAWSSLEQAQTAFLDRAHDVLLARANGGHVKDGHGDLRLEHVYFEGREVIVVDCIEFNDRFRFADTALDLAFLSMDLRRFGRPDLAEDFLAAVAGLGGDYEAYALVDFYESYRATVRGKVAALREGQLEPSSEAARSVHEEAARLLTQALAALTNPDRPQLICIGGLIASGKSTLARGLSRALHCPVIDSDSTRKRLFGVQPTKSLAAAPFSDAYSAEASRRTYERVAELARAVLKSGRSVIVDASLRTREQRRAFVAFAARENVPFSFIECFAAEGVVLERLRRRAQGPSTSDGVEQLLPALRAASEPIEDGELPRLLRCDTSAGDGRPIEQARRFIEHV